MHEYHIYLILKRLVYVTQSRHKKKRHNSVIVSL